MKHHSEVATVIFHPPLAGQEEKILDVSCLKPPIGETVITIYAALEVSNATWVLAIGYPTETPKTRLHTRVPHDVDELRIKLADAPS